MFEDYSEEPLFNVKAIATQTGVQASTLRAWERRYGIPSPPRTGTGYRLYSARDVAMVHWLKQQTDGGLSISQAVSLLKSIRAGQRKPASEKRQVPANPPALSPRTFRRFVDAAFEAACALNEAALEAVLSEAFTLYALEDVSSHVIFPLQVRVGAAWHNNLISSSIEHFVTSIIRRKLMGLLLACSPPTDKRRIVAACAPEEHHEIGMLVLTLLLRRSGKDVVFLGQNTPLFRLDEVLSHLQTNLLLVSATTFRSAATLADVADLLHDKKMTAVVLAYGGNIFESIPALQRFIPGIYLGNDISRAPAQVSGLLDSGSLFTRRLVRLPPEVKTALLDFRLRRPEVLARVMERIRNEPAFNYEQTAYASTQFADAIEAALRLNAPEMLQHPMTWQLNAKVPVGPSITHLQFQAQRIASAVQEVLPPNARTIVGTAVAYLARSLELYKD
jgi:DNA-binding transcriptional MerR regulator/methylmalonyl-CoA mutase cobalamin-binding subunit